MPPGSAANRALQIDAIGKTRDCLTGGFAPSLSELFMVKSNLR
jgi:hypothetical protein